MKLILCIALSFTLLQTFSQTKFGYSSIPPESVGFSLGSANNPVFTKINLPTAHNITEIGVYIGNTTANAYCIIYEDSGNNLGNLVTYSGPQALNTNAVNTFILITPVILPAGDYWVGIQADQNSVILGRTLATGNDIRFWFSPSFGVFADNPPNTLLPDLRTPSIWITGTAVPVPTLSQWGIMILLSSLLILGVVAYREKVFAVEKDKHFRDVIT